MNMNLNLFRPRRGSLTAALVLGAAGIGLAGAHPHDLLAQCQLPDGSWKMCDETIHDVESGAHVPQPNSAEPKRPGRFVAKPSGGGPAVPGGPAQFKAVAPKCLPGFKPQADASGNFSCTSGKPACPKGRVYFSSPRPLNAKTPFAYTCAQPET